MRRRFSDKYGYTEVKNTLQKEAIDERLRNRIWNTVTSNIFQPIITEFGSIKYENDYEIFKKLYDEIFGVRGQPTKNLNDLVNDIHEQYCSFYYWYDFYNFLEDIIYVHHDNKIIDNFKKEINKVLEQEISAYRFVDDCISPIIDEIEIKEIEDVFSSNYDSVKGHLSKALEHLSDRENPDFQNSIKESITAVESVAQIITNSKKDLGACIKLMDLDIQKQFTKTLSGLYTWTCQAEGIRHPHNTGEELKTGFDEAKFMLVTCSAFINYLISKHKS